MNAALEQWRKRTAKRLHEAGLAVRFDNRLYGAPCKGGQPKRTAWKEEGDERTRVQRR